MRKWTLIFDVDRCNGCCNCSLATKDEYVGNTHSGYAEEMPRHGSSWLAMRVVERGAHPFVDVGYMPETCHHCDDAPCVRRFPHAITRRDDGIVIIDPVRARGNRAIADACPLGAIHWNEEKQVAQHWNLDAHLLDAGWREPRAAQACPTGALRALRLTDTELDALKCNAELDQPAEAKALGSRLYFKGLHRLTSTLIGGSAASLAETAEEPLIGARVEIRAGGSVLGRACTDELGNFRCELAADPGHEIEIALQYEDRSLRHTVRKTDGVFRVGVLILDTHSHGHPAAQANPTGAPPPSHQGASKGMA